MHFERIIPISAKDEKNIVEVKTAVRDVLDEYAEKQLNEDDFLSRVLSEQLRNKIA